MFGTFTMDWVWCNISSQYSALLVLYISFCVTIIYLLLLISPIIWQVPRADIMKQIQCWIGYPRGKDEAIVSARSVQQLLLKPTCRALLKHASTLCNAEGILFVHNRYLEKRRSSTARFHCYTINSKNVTIQNIKSRIWGMIYDWYINNLAKI